MKVMFVLFSVVAVLALVAMLFISVQARRSESCQCFYVGECSYDDQGVGYKYYLCRGSCAGYSAWVADPRCQTPGITIPTKFP